MVGAVLTGDREDAGQEIGRVRTQRPSYVLGQGLGGRAVVAIPPATTQRTAETGLWLQKSSPGMMPSSHCAQTCPSTTTSMGSTCARDLAQPGGFSGRLGKDRVG